MPDDTTPPDGPEFPPAARRAEPDAHGQAALLLAESILHALVETKAMSTAQAVATARTACEVKVEVAEEAGETQGRMRESLGLLAGIERSLTAGGHDPDGTVTPFRG